MVLLSPAGLRVFDRERWPHSSALEILDLKSARGPEITVCSGAITTEGGRGYRATAVSRAWGAGPLEGSAAGRGREELAARRAAEGGDNAVSGGLSIGCIGLALACATPLFAQERFDSPRRQRGRSSTRRRSTARRG